MDKAELDTELRGAVARAEDAQWQTLQEKERLEDDGEGDEKEDGSGWRERWQKKKKTTAAQLSWSYLPRGEKDGMIEG